MKQLKAIHPFDIVVGGTYVTVRRGWKWADETTNGEEIELIRQDPNDRTQEKKVGSATITIRKVLETFHSISARDIEFEHEADSRLYSGLLASMRNAYGNDFMQDEPVCLIFYRVDDIEQ